MSLYSKLLGAKLLGVLVLPAVFAVFRYRVISDKQQAFREIEALTRSERRPSWGEAVKQWLESKGALTGEQISAIESRQASLRELLGNKGIDVSPVHFSAEEQEFARLYRNAVFKWGSLKDGENLLRVKLLYQNGGVGDQRHSLPAINEAAFTAAKAGLRNQGLTHDALHSP